MCRGMSGITGVSGEVRGCLDEAVESVTWGLGGLRGKSILHLRKLVLWSDLYHKQSLWLPAENRLEGNRLVAQRPRSDVS